MEKQHGIIGDSFGTDLPQAEIAEDGLQEQRNRVKFSKSKEWQELKAHCEEKITYYQTFLPNGSPIAGMSPKQAAEHWTVANLIVAEFKQLIDKYESAAGIVKEADRNAR